MFKKAALIFAAVASLTIANTAHAWIGGDHFDYWENASYTDWIPEKQLFFWRFGYTVSVNGRSVQGPGGDIVGKPNPDSLNVDFFFQFKPSEVNVSIKDISLHLTNGEQVRFLDNTPFLFESGIVTIGKPVSLNQITQIQQADNS